ncbi:MAG: hypothetical protein SFH39_08395 [Candidatus Magnetobacterium sp. LHC-1]|uniref:DUF4258 domain-containing protein n=1 Tax=Candidatus Magnetobacterium casense TaxID=1455061 RepID=A0ABS6RUC1_9BACT|nr:hypothetical protein [Candidatus Magnetobacterium casensis]MBF0609029.1 hypothetical protein [Nitrospirota bacterium]MBV6340234.1 hypothetical protein [Candidatus Magnetobacterium casensis]
MKAIRLSIHARAQSDYRGVQEREIHEAILSSKWEPANRGRLQASKDFTFEREWNKKYYKYKQVKPVFIEEETELVVITVYAYYFNKEVDK